MSKKIVEAGLAGNVQNSQGAQASQRERINDPRWANDSNLSRYFLKENTQMSNGTPKQCSISLVIKEIQPNNGIILLP